MHAPICLGHRLLRQDAGCHAPIEEVVADAVSGGVGMVQVREKNMPTGELYRLAEKLRLVTLGKALLIINDRIDIALAVDADGVHLPSHSLPIDVAKRLCGERLLIGRSVHSVEEAVAAENDGVDYLILGTIYGTASHPGREGSGPGLVAQVKNRVQVPIYAIGGVNASNAEEVMRAGFSEPGPSDGIAVIRSILGQPETRVPQLNREISPISLRIIANLRKEDPPRDPKWNFTVDMLDLSDSHTHLEDYGDQLPQVVQRARDVGVRRIITAGSSLESSRAAVRIAEDYPDIYAGVGIHPHAAHLNITEETFEQLAGLARSSEKVLMVCEPGLDYFKSKAPRELQQDVFRRHLRLARELGSCPSCSTAGKPTGTASAS